MSKSSSSKGWIWTVVAGVVIFVVVLVVVVIIKMQGNVQYNDTNPPSVKVASTTCQSSIVSYVPLESVATPKGKGIRVNIIFENDKAKNMSLEYTSTYEDGEKARAAYNHMSTTLGPRMVEAGFRDSDAFNNQFTIEGDRIILSLYAEKDEISKQSAQFFAIKLDDGETMPRTKVEFTKKYASEGFRCQDN